MISETGQNIERTLHRDCRVERTAESGLLIEAIANIGPIYAQPAGSKLSDVLTLSWQQPDGTDKVVMWRELDDCEVITKAACVNIDGSVGYILGGDDLEETLSSRGFRRAKTFHILGEA